MNDINVILENNYITGESYDIIAFDVFDTILYRTVSPERVLELWADKIIYVLGLKDTVEILLKKRRISGWIAKLENIMAGLDKECSYRQFIVVFRYMINTDLSIDELYELSLKIEEEIEIKVTYIPEATRELLLSALKTKKCIICISDYYLPATVLSRIIKSNGIIIDKVFSSSDMGKLKSTGNIYPEVSRIMGKKTECIVMMGDNRMSDYVNAKKKGCQAVWLKNDEQYIQKERNKRQTEARSEFYSYNRELLKSNLPFMKLSGPLYLFIDGLYKQLLLEGCTTVLFMSREGLFFKKLFDLYQSYKSDSEHIEVKIRTEYFYCSRQAALVSSITTIDKDSFKEIYKNYPTLKVSDFLRNLDLLDDSEIRNEFKDLLEKDNVIEKFEYSKEYSRILSSKVFMNKCLSKASEQRRLFMSYLKELHPNYEKEGLFIVDIGYHGTSSKSISKTLNNEVPVRTYYMLSQVVQEEYDGINAIKGILFDRNKGEKLNIFTYDEMVIETLMTANHGSVVCYKSEGDRVVPVFRSDHRETDCYDTIIGPIQDDIYKAFLRQLILIQSSGLDANSYKKVFEKAYKYFMFTPSKSEMFSYMKITYIDNFASYRENTASEVNNHYREFSLVNLIKLIKSKGFLIREQNTNWIAVALYKMNLNCLNKILLMCSLACVRGYDSYLRIRTKL